MNGNGLVTGVAVGQAKITAKIGQTRASAIVTVTAPALAPAAPTNLATGVVSTSQINLTWTDNATNESGFRIERCSGTGCTSFAEIATVGVNATSYQNTGLLPATSYSYRVRAYNQAGTSGYSNWSSKTTQTQTEPAPAPAPPTDPPVVDPSWIVVNPGENIQSLVNLYPSGTTFYLTAGTHIQQQVTPKSGDTFIGEPGAIMDGQNVTAYAFYSNNKGQSNVTIKSLEIKNYTTPSADYGAITGQNVTNWIVTDNVVHHNAQAGIRAGTGTGWQVLRNTAYANGVAGITGYQCNGGLIQGNELYGNNPTGAFTMREGGMKVFQSVNLTIRGNNVHHNKGKGIWSDTNYPTMLIEGNTVTDNSGTGIYHEIGYAAIIRNNTSSRNGNGSEQVSGSLTRAGIQVTNSPNVQVYGNTVMDNHNGISGLYFSGYPTTGPYGAYVLQNLSVHDNVVRMSIGRAGIAKNTGDTSIYYTNNNHFDNNTYYLGPNATYFSWSDQYLLEQQWQAVGNDETGTFTR